MTLVLCTEDYDAQCIAWLGERCEVLRCAPTDGSLFDDLAQRAEGLLVRTYTRVDADLLARMPRLRVVGRAGVALENIDALACRERGVAVVHTPNSNTRAVVEFFTAVLMDALRPRVFLDDALEPEDWHAARRELVGEWEANELTLGILGFGRIGSAVARVGEALDMPILYHDLREIAPERWGSAKPVSFERVLAESDVLSVHVDYRASNAGLLGAPEFERMKPGALLINTSRGFVIDAAALATHLRAHPDCRAILDVHDPLEPIPGDYPLLGLPNASLTPHLASGTVKAKRDMSWVVCDLWGVLQGELAQNPPPAWLYEEGDSL
ncbi:MAG: 3-phosphoglycerate dehydrogenase [Phycisphaeraceae bacterium]|nr:MAG: 3-phosphoglycerate dehydrogenase [Phycisphaeraceae bacterium]